MSVCILRNSDLSYLFRETVSINNWNEANFFEIGKQVALGI